MNRQQCLDRAMQNQKNSGFTLIEMIGVLAIIAILAAAIAPRVFEVIADSRGTRMATDVRAIETAVTRYYGDVGTIKDLEATTGTAQLDSAGTTYWQTLVARTPKGSAGAWARFSGPYLEKFVETAPAVGTGQTLILDTPPLVTVPAATNNLSFDLDGIADAAGDRNDTPANLAGGPQSVVVLVIADVDFGDFEKVDSIFDEGVAGAKETSGRVKYHTDQVMRILVAYR